ncbi:MAG: antibiotic biosynthesis monooxygenase [Chloroflexi bacterium]|nr:antibiotic biosynthesis monooxygenase [Chloroflexota bacterium]
MTKIARTPEPPYFAVIFTSLRTEGDTGFAAMAEKMVELATFQSGFIGVESARDKIGITVTYWTNMEAILSWSQNAQHKLAWELGYQKWYQSFKLRVCKVERDYDFARSD